MNHQEALKAVLVALNGLPHWIRELQATRGLPDNPIDFLIKEFNESKSEVPLADTELAALREELAMTEGLLLASNESHLDWRKRLADAERRNVELVSAIENHLKGTGSSPGATRRYAELRAALNKPEEAKS